MLRRGGRKSGKCPLEIRGNLGRAWPEWMPGKALLWDREVLEGGGFVANRMGRLVLWSRGRALGAEWDQGCCGDEGCSWVCKD